MLMLLSGEGVADSVRGVDAPEIPNGVGVGD